MLMREILLKMRQSRFHNVTTHFRSWRLRKIMFNNAILLLFVLRSIIIIHTFSANAFQINPNLKLRDIHMPILTIQRETSFYSKLQYLSFHDYSCTTLNDRTSTCTSLYMGKGDGKKKRKKKSASAGAGTQQQTQSSASLSPPPMRVTSDSLVPVRRQIRWAQMKKEAARNSGTSFRQTNVKRTKYRKSLDEEEIEQAKLERQRRGKDVDWDVILNATASAPLVIVDGYNIIHQWPRLKKWMNKGMVSKAREMIIHDLEELRTLKGWRIEVVFDGFGKSTNGPLGDGPGSKMKRDQISKVDEIASKKVTNHGVRIVFSGVGTSADGYIESRCFEAKKVTDGKLTSSLIVATNDNMIRSVGVNAGAICMSADRLVDELKAVRASTLNRVEVAVAKANGHAVRPPKLRDTVMSTGLTRGAIIIEDKRKRREKKTKKDEDEYTRTLEDLKKGTTSLPSWAIIPSKDN